MYQNEYDSTNGIKAAGLSRLLAYYAAADNDLILTSSIERAFI